jgi:hypothetical protein
MTKPPHQMGLGYNDTLMEPKNDGPGKGSPPMSRTSALAMFAASNDHSQSRGVARIRWLGQKS